MSELRLALDIPARAPLDEPLVVLARLDNAGADATVTSARLNLLEGDLSMAVAPPGGAARPVVWPWPMDSPRREVTLAPGQRLEGGVLLHWSVAGQVFEAAGRFALTAEFTPSPLDPAVTAPAHTVLRDDATDGEGLARQRMLLEPDVGRSLASASVLGGAGSALAELAASGAAPVTRFLATIALGDADAVGALAGDTDPLDAARWTTAVLPGGLFPGDRRVGAVREAVGGDARAAAILDGRPA